MRNLLAKQERRWFHFLEILTTEDDWVILSDLSSALDCSKRILKMDIKTLNESFKDFQLVTSNKGVKVEYHTNYSFKTFCQQLLALSDNYRLLEIIFFNDGLLAKDVANKLGVSLSTLYRIVEQLNKQLEPHFNFIVETGPCRITGDEENIRFFFYIYFFEKYRHIDWPFDKINLDTIVTLTDEFMRTKDFPDDFIYFNAIRVVFMVNYIRFKNNYHLAIDVNEKTVQRLLLNKPDDAALRQQMEDTIQAEYNEEFIGQVLAPFVKTGIYHSLEAFKFAVEKDEHLKENMQKLRQILAIIAANNNIPILNIDHITYALYNTVALEYSQPQSRHILYNRNGFFAQEIKKQFPGFYQDLYDGMAEYQIFIGQPVRESSIHYYIFIVFSWWENLVTELLKKLHKINVLVISDQHHAHAKMMANYLQFEFGEKLDIHTTDLFFVTSKSFDLSKYDLIISTFMDEQLLKRRAIYVGNMIKPAVLTEIQAHIDDILENRMDTERS